MSEHDRRVREQFTAQVEGFRPAPHVNAAEPVARFVALVAPGAHERVLDVACGPGLLARAFAPHVAAFIGIDLTPAMVARARADGTARAAFAVGHALALPVAGARVDLVLTRLALHHIRDPAAALAESARVLRPGGRLAIWDTITSERADEAAYHHHVETLRDPSHARMLPVSELLRLVGGAGLEAERLEVVAHPIEVEEWLARARQDDPRDTAAVRALIGAAEGTRRLGGARVFRDATGRLSFEARWALLLARRPAS